MIHIPTDKGEMAVQELQQLRAQQGNANANQPSDAKQQADVSFGDVLDIVNPLQHIPGVSNLYREITGDEISGQARALGGALYGGPIGLLAGSLSAAMTEESGQSVPGTLAAAFTSDGAGGGSQTQTTKTAAASNAADAAAQPSSANDTDTRRAATAALPSGIESVLPAAPAGAAPASSGGGAAAEGAPAAQQANGAEVLQGKDALAAFARDKAAQTKGSGAEAAQTGTEREAQQTARNQGAAAAQRNSSAGERAAKLNQQQDFMKLRNTDYATSAEMRARMQHLDEYQAQAANDVSPQVDSNASATHAKEPSGRSDQRGIQPSGTPDDFASRMKEALSKYRTMHNNQ